MKDLATLMQTLSFDESCKTCLGPREEVEFYCRSCCQAICRNCLLKYHLNLNFGSSSQEQQKIKEKQDLLDQYERKTMSERMTVSLKAELKLDEEVMKAGPDGQAQQVQAVIEALVGSNGEWVELPEL